MGFERELVEFSPMRIRTFDPKETLIIRVPYFCSIFVNNKAGVKTYVLNTPSSREILKDSGSEFRGNHLSYMVNGKKHVTFPALDDKGVAYFKDVNVEDYAPPEYRGELQVLNGELFSVVETTSTRGARVNTVKLFKLSSEQPPTLEISFQFLSNLTRMSFSSADGLVFLAIKNEHNICILRHDISGKIFDMQIQQSFENIFTGKQSKKFGAIVDSISVKFLDNRLMMYSDFTESETLFLLDWDTRTMKDITPKLREALPLVGPDELMEIEIARICKNYYFVTARAEGKESNAFVLQFNPDGSFAFLRKYFTGITNNFFYFLDSHRLITSNPTGMFLINCPQEE